MRVPASRQVSPTEKDSETMISELVYALPNCISFTYSGAALWRMYINMWFPFSKRFFRNWWIMKGKSTGSPPWPDHPRWWKCWLAEYHQPSLPLSGIPCRLPEEYKSNTRTLALKSIFVSGLLGLQFNLSTRKENCRIRSKLRWKYVNKATRTTISFLFELVFSWEQVYFTVERSLFQPVSPLNEFLFVSDRLLDLYNFLAVLCFFHTIVAKSGMIYSQHFVLILNWLWFFGHCSTHEHKTIITFIIS